MTNKQRNKFRSYEAIHQVFEDNAPIIEAHAPLQETVERFKQQFQEINGMSVDQTTDTSGVTDQKAIRKEQLAEIASEIASSGYSFAFEREDSELMAIFDFPYSEIRYTADQNAVNIASMIHQEASKRLEDLKEELVTEEDLQELAERLEQFQALTQKQQGMQSSGVAGTKRLAILFREMDALLANRLDKLVYKIKRKEPVFFDTYANAREIRDLGRRKQPEESFQNS